jgi:hypothetical protein
MEGSEEHHLEDVDVPHFRLENLAVTPPAGADFTQEHVQWAIATRFPDHITGIDHGQAGGESIA